MISADIKADVKQQEIKDSVAVSYNTFHRSTFSKTLNYNQAYFSFSL